MLKIHNSLTRRKETFVPIEPGKVRMYVCGMTVYDLCHLGHARVMVVFDTVVRYLRHRGFDVTYVRNITDIDDKPTFEQVDERSTCVDAGGERRQEDVPTRAEEADRPRQEDQNQEPDHCPQTS